MTPDEIRNLAIECGAIEFVSPRVIAGEDTFEDCFRMWPDELAAYTAAVEARERERIQQEINNQVVGLK